MQRSSDLPSLSPVREHAIQQPTESQKKRSRDGIENLLLASRWLLLPFYALLLAMLLPLLAMAGREFVHVVPIAYSGTGSDLILSVLSILDLVLLANLVVMVAVSSYESFISRIEAEADEDRPEWLGRLDAGGVKVKVAISITMIAAVQMLRGFMEGADPTRLAVSAGVLTVFVLVAFVVARTGSHGNSNTLRTFRRQTGR